MANEKRLIDAEKVYQALHNAGGCDAPKDSWADGWDKAIDEAIRLLNNQPTVDAVEVVHGRWIEKVDMVESYLADCTEVFYECSVCECANIGESPYCPNCGAKMEGSGNV